MHYWGDEWFQKNGKDLDNAISHCMKIWKKYGRIGTHGKEKYGTFRDHVWFYNAWWAIHELIKPGYMYYSQWPRWFYKLDLLLGRCVRFLKLYKIVQWYQKHIYNYAIQQACKKYPHIVDELVSNLDGYKFIKPGIFGDIDGEVIHNKYWTLYKGEK